MSVSKTQALTALKVVLAFLEDSGAQPAKKIDGRSKEARAAKAAAAGKAPAVKPAKAPKVKATSKDPKSLAKALLEEGKYDGRSAEGKALRAFVEGKTDLRSKEGRELRAVVNPLLGLAAPKKPGPKAKAKPEAAPKAAKAAPKAKSEPPKKAAKAAASSGGTLKEKASKALEAGTFDGRSKEGKVLKEFVESKADGRSKEGREVAVAVSEILGLPAPKKPGPKPKGGEKAASGKGVTDAASEAPTPSPKKTTTGAKPRAIDAVEMVLTEHGTMKAGEVVAALEAKGWMPASNDPKTYISFILSQNKEKFERDPAKPRGHYRVKGSGATTPSPAPAATEPKEAKSSNGKSTEDVSDLPVAGDNVNPFAEELSEDPVLGG